MAALWPDADGDAAKTSFDTTLFRLRKLLDVDDALVLSAGKLSLARSVAWTDVWALEVAFDAARSRRADEARGPSPRWRTPRRPARCLSRPAAGCRGARVDRQAARRAARAVRAHAVRARASASSSEGDLATAIDVYRRGLEADNLAESFYRGLMRALAATGDQAEALNAFRRCRELLSIVLGVKPSAETDHLSREIAAGSIPASLS